MYGCSSSVATWMLLGLLVHLGQACTSGSGQSLEGLLGGTFKANPFPNRRTGQFIDVPGDLTCDFSSNYPCRWGTDAKGSGSTHWYQGTGQPNQNVWQQSTGTSQMPNPPFAIASIGAVGDGDWLSSDPIKCQRPDGQLMFSYWASPGTSVRVCAIRQSDGSQLWCSKEYTQTSSPPSPGPALEYIPMAITTPFFLAFIPKGVSTGNGFVAVDEVAYYSADVQCQATTTTSTTTTTPRTTAWTTSQFNGGGGVREVCTKLPCNFESGSCGWNLNVGDTPYHLIRDYYPKIGSTRLTEVRRDQRVDHVYCGANVHEGHRAVMASPIINVDQPNYYRLKVLTYTATNGARLSACYDAGLTDCEILFPYSQMRSRNFPYSLEHVGWREWTSSRTLPAGSRQVFFVSEFFTNDADFAGFGVDNIQATGC